MVCKKKKKQKLLIKRRHFQVKTVKVPGNWKAVLAIVIKKVQKKKKEKELKNIYFLNSSLVKRPKNVMKNSPNKCLRNKVLTKVLKRK